MYSIEEISNLVEPIFKNFGIKQVYLFGSYARGTAKETSDIDFMYSEAKTGELFIFTVMDLQDELERALDKEVHLTSLLNFKKSLEIGRNAYLEQVSEDLILIYDYQRGKVSV